MPEPREVLLLRPLARREFERATTLLFAPAAAAQQVRIRLVGVPVDDLLDGTLKRWWPLECEPYGHCGSLGSSRASARSECGDGTSRSAQAALLGGYLLTGTSRPGCTC
ncbi:MAG TPA: hypothetical protein VMK12_03305 [Anaeromyxobacteraceae bacterium]|nr:hypothetical protein [Anaeromyxobacteraceae bacterium]